MTNRTIKKSLRGFTLIETLVAVLLLVSAVTGPLTIASKGLSAALVARDQMLAFYLAQDAVEYVRYVRDSNCLAAGAGSCTASVWFNGLSACTRTDGCTIDPITQAVAQCTGACQVLKKYDNTDGSEVKHPFYTYAQGNITPQQFIRTIKILAPDGSTNITNEGVLTVSVSWRQQSGVVRTIAVRENMFDWQ